MRDTDPFTKQVIKRMHITTDRLIKNWGSRGGAWEVWKTDKSAKMRLMGLFSTKKEAKKFEKELLKKKIKGMYDY